MVNVPLVQDERKFVAKRLNVRLYPCGSLRAHGVVTEVHERGEVAVVLRELVRLRDVVDIN